MKRQYSLLKNTLIYSLYNVSVRGINYLIIPLIAIVLNKEDFGKIGLILSISTIIGFFLNLGFDNSINRFFHDDKIKRQDYLGTFLYMSIKISLFTSLAFLLLVPILNWLSLLPLSTQDFMIAFLCGLSLLYIKYYDRVLKAEGRATELALFGFKRAIVKSPLLLLFVFYLYGNYLGYFIALIISSAIFFIYSIRELLKKCKIAYDEKIAQEIKNYSVPLIPNRMAAFLVEPAHQILTSSMQGLSSAGLFFIATSITKPINIICNSFVDSYTPWLYNELKTRSNQKKIKSKSTKTIISVSIICFLISLLIEDFSKLLFKKDLEDIGLILNFLIFNCLVNFIKNLNLSLLLYNKTKTSLIQWPTYLNLLLNIVLGLFLIPKVGYLGSGIAMFTSRYISGSSTYYFASRNSPVNIGWQYVLILPIILLGFSIIVNFHINTLLQKIVLILITTFFWLKYFGGQKILQKVFKKVI